MRPAYRLAAVPLIAFLFAGCAALDLRPVEVIDPGPYIESIRQRRAVLEGGVSGVLEMDFSNGRRRFRGKGYIVAFPDGRFRLEIPGPMGSTHLVMSSDGKDVLAWYPEEGKAYRSAADGRSISPHLPFPLPVNPEILPALIMGVFPEGREPVKVRGARTRSGMKTVGAFWGETGLFFTHVFRKGDVPSLQEIRASEGDMRLKVLTGEGPEHLPRKFSLTYPETSFTGEWEKAVLFRGKETVLTLKIPESVDIIELEGSP